MAHYCVRGEAIGTADGGNWVNAFTTYGAAKAAGYSRDDDIWIADGVFVEQLLLDLAEDGVLPVRIHKATDDNHGPEVGWDPSYGDGQATFAQGLNIDSSYWEIDGQTGGFDGVSTASLFAKNQGFDFGVAVMPNPTQISPLSIAAGLQGITIEHCIFDYSRSDYYGGEIGGASDPTRWSEASGEIISIGTGSSPTLQFAANHGLSSGDRIGVDGTNCTPPIPSGRHPVTVTGLDTLTITPGVTITGAGDSGDWKQIMGGEPLCDLIGTSGAHISDVTIRHCYIGTAGNSGIQGVYLDNVLIEHTAWDDIYGVDGVGWHQSAMSCRRVDGLEIRYSAIRDVGGSSLIGFYNDSLVNGDGDSWRNDGFVFFGCLIYQKDVPGDANGHGIGEVDKASNPLPSRNCTLVQNSVAQMDTLGGTTKAHGSLGKWDVGSTNCVAKNNVVIDTEVCSVANSTDVSHFTTKVNILLDALISGDPNHQPTTDGVDVWFTDIDNDDLSLAQDTDARASLDPAYDLDMFGNVFTSSRGAIQYDGTPPDPEPEPEPPAASLTRRPTLLVAR